MSQDFFWFFFFLLNGIQAKMKKCLKKKNKKTLGKKTVSFSASKAGSPLNQFLISVLFLSVPVKWI